jgi:hypothetical protein
MAIILREGKHQSLTAHVAAKVSVVYLPTTMIFGGEEFSCEKGIGYILLPGSSAIQLVPPCTQTFEAEMPPP